MKTKSHSQSAFFNRRVLIALACCLVGAFLALAGFAQNQRDKQSTAQWPTLKQQLSQEYLGFKIQKGTALEALVRDNQDFSMLRDDEKADKRTLPPWLRVWFRKQHPELEYSSQDPTGGYPHALKEILEWMLTHQDLKAGPGLEKKTGGQSANEPDEVDATIGSDIRISGAQSVPRSESDIRINYFDPTKIISASNNITGSGKQAIYYSTNSGTSWSQTLLPATGSDTSHSDPTCDWTSDGRAWSATLGIQGGSLRFRNYFSTDNGATWTFEATASGTQTSVDKEMFWVDHSASSPFQNQIYGIWHNGNPAFMNRRTMGAGGTWLASPIQVSGAESTGTCIGGDVKTNSAGDVFGSWPTTTNSKIFLVKSTNGGASYSAPVQITTTYDSYDIGVPSFNNRRALIYVSLGAYRTAVKNNVYVAWTDLSGDAGCTAPGNEPGSNVNSTCKTRIWFSRSTDGGATWSPRIRVNNQAGLNDQYNQWLAVDETTGGIGIMYYDTVSDAGRKKSDIWYQSSADDGGSWSPAQKVTTGMTDETTGGQDSGNQYGDYNALSAYANVFFPSWTDRRNLAKEEIWTAKITDLFAPVSIIGNGGSTIVAGTCGNPATINPGSTLTVNFCVQNTGNLDTANLVGTLQATGGVANPSGPQNYGVVTSGGGSVCRTFTFAASAACGGTVTASLQLQDGATNLGTVTYTFTLAGMPNTLYSEAVDSVAAPALPAGWVATNASGPAPFWVSSTTTPDSAPNDLFVDDPASVSDKLLETAPISINTPTAKLTFRNNYNLESGTSFYDGGVLEVSSPNINGGAYTDITNAAVGGSFVSGGYVGTISTGFSSPIAGRQAWSGSSGGYVTTVANLGPNVAGRTIKLRFRMGSDSAVGAAGWRVDTLSISDGFICAPAALSAVSRKLHAGVPYDISLPLTGAPGVECRTGPVAGEHQVVVTFANPVSLSGASVTSGTGNVANASASGSQVTVNLSGVTNAQTLAISLSDVNDGTNMGCVAIPMAILAGDTTGNRIVNASDVSQAKLQSGQPISVSNFRNDVTVNGIINASDVSSVKTKSGTALP